MAFFFNSSACLADSAAAASFCSYSFWAALFASSAFFCASIASYSRLSASFFAFSAAAASAWALASFYAASRASASFFKASCLCISSFFSASSSNFFWMLFDIFSVKPDLLADLSFFLSSSYLSSCISKYRRWLSARYLSIVSCSFFTFPLCILLLITFNACSIRNALCASAISSSSFLALFVFLAEILCASSSIIRTRNFLSHSLQISPRYLSPLLSSFAFGKIRDFVRQSLQTELPQNWQYLISLSF